MKLDVTLNFDSEESAQEAGYPDAVLVDDDIPSLGYMVVVSLFCDAFSISEDYEYEEEGFYA